MVHQFPEFHDGLTIVLQDFTGFVDPFLSGPRMADLEPMSGVPGKRKIQGIAAPDAVGGAPHLPTGRPVVTGGEQQVVVGAVVGTGDVGGQFQVRQPPNASAALDDACRDVMGAVGLADHVVHQAEGVGMVQGRVAAADHTQSGAGIVA